MDFLTNIIAGIASQVGNQVGSAITAVLSYLVNGVQKSVIEPVTSGISSTLREIESGVTSLERSATTGIENTISAASNSIGQFISAAETGFSSSLRAVESGVSSLAQSITTVFEQITTSVENGFTSIAGAVGAAIAKTAELVQQGLEDAAKIMATSIATVFTPIAQFIEALPQDIATIAGDVVAELKAVGSTVERVAVAAEKTALKYAPADLIRFVKDLQLKDYGDLFNHFGPEFVSMLEAATGIKFTGEFGVAMGRVSAIASAEFAIGSMEEFFPGAAFIMARLLNHIADSIAVGDFRALVQAGNEGSPNELLSTGDAVTALYRGNISNDQFHEIMLKRGYAAENADVLYQNSAALLGLGELITLFRRGLIPDIKTLYDRAAQVRAPKETVDDALVLYSKLLGIGEAVELTRRGITPEGWKTPLDDLVREGFTQERIDALIAISTKLPSVFEYQDFVARQVDDEAHVEKFQLDYGIDDEYFKIAKANGYDEKTARRIYRSYWNLPPFFLLASEFKAGKIDEQTMRDALAFQRFTPYWIDKFVDQLKPSISQAEIKDMYKYKLIGADEIVPRLQAIGVAPDLAAELSKLWQASVKQANPNDQTADQLTAAAIKGETEGLIKTGYIDGIMTRQSAHDHLVALGKTDEAASLILEIADHEIQQQAIKDTFAIDKEDFLAGNIDLNTVTNDLTNAGASPIQLQKYILQLQRASKSKPKSPTLAEFKHWFKTQMITATEFVQGLQLLGYSDTWIPFYLLEAGVEAKAILEMGYTIQVPYPVF